MNSMSGLVTENPQVSANDLVTAKQMAEALHQHYPGHLWAVTCDGNTGMADVRNLALSGNWGFRLKLRDIYSASEFKKEVMRAGGELLERYRLRRGVLNQDHYSTLETDFAGRIKADRQ